MFLEQEFNDNFMDDFYRRAGVKLVIYYDLQFFVHEYLHTKFSYIAEENIYASKELSLKVNGGERKEVDEEQLLRKSRSDCISVLLERVYNSHTPTMVN